LFVKKCWSYALFRLRQFSNFILRRFLIATAFAYACLPRARNKKKLSAKAALLLPTADPGNLGDEAFFAGAVEELREMGYQRVCVISFHSEKVWKVPGAETVVLALHHNPAGSEYIRFVDFASRFTHFFIWGADILDGSQGLRIAIPRFRLANLATTLGLKTSICSFSLNSKPADEVIDGFRNLDARVVLYAREEISRERLERHLGPGRVRLSADVAFLLRPDHTASLARETAAWVAERKQAGKIVMGLNINDMLCYYFPQMTPALLVERYVEALIELRKRFPNLAILHIPHNIHVNPTPHNTDDFALAAIFNETLPEELRNDSRMLPRTVRATEVRAACSYVDFVFSGRMHLTIASLSEGTPVFAVAYQGKFEGLFRHFGLEKMLVTEADLMDPNATAAFLENGIRRLPRIREQIGRRLPVVKDLARLNLVFQ